MSASGAATVTCTAGPGTAVRTRLAAGGITVTCTAGPGVGVSPRVARGAATVYAMALPGKAENGVFVTPNQRWRIAVQACRGGPGGGPGPILTYDLKVTNLLLNRNLSDGCDISFDVNLNDTSAAGLQFKSYGYYIHASKIMYPGKERLWCTGITQPSDVDETSPILHLKAKGYAAYPKDIPWLEDLNWVANDAFRPVVEIWRHLQQDFPNGNLDVQVYPAASGVEMLPGYAFDGNLLNLNFFATFIRQTDKLDCGDYINALARDIPFDYREESEWNADRSGVIKRLHLGYPRLGVIQENLAFVLTENVLSAKPHTEATTDYATDVGVTGWFPGIEYDSQLSNADPDRLRRYLSEDDAFIDSNERAKAWAGRRLARRQTPPYWETITINPLHSNAPFGSFDVGDTIPVSGDMPGVGYISQDHKIIAISIKVDDKSGADVTQLTLKAEGAFNYDPIFFPGGVTNIIFNSGFDFNLSGWTATGPGWAWDGTQGSPRLGSVKITADGTDHDLLTQSYGLNPFQIFPMSIKVKCSGAASVAGSAAVQLVAQFYDDDNNPTQAFEVAALSGPAGMVPWVTLSGNLLTPAGSTRVAMRLHVDAAMTGGDVWFDNAVIQL